MTILLIDDDEDILNILTIYSRRAFQRNIVTANSGIRGLEVFYEEETSGSIALVVCDTQMPEISGIEVVSAIRKVNKKVPIILITGRDTNDLMNHMESLAIKNILKKTIGFDKIIDVMKELLEEAESNGAKSD